MYVHAGGGGGGGGAGGYNGVNDGVFKAFEYHKFAN